MKEPASKGGFQAIVKHQVVLGTLLLVLSVLLMTAWFWDRNAEVSGGIAFLSGLIAFAGIDLITHSPMGDR